MSSLSAYCPAFARVLAVTLVLLAVSPLLNAASKAEKEVPHPKITYDAADVYTDFKTHEIRLRGDVTITYGKMTVRADRALATAADFKNSRWTFDGNVRIDAVPRGNLRSDEAVVEFQDNQLMRATATGSPAEFDQTRDDSNVIARGHADQIVYEVSEGTIRLARLPKDPKSDDSWVTDGRNELRAPEIVYSLREERVQATTSPGTERVHVTIAPNEGPKADGSEANKPKSIQPDSANPQPSAPQMPTPPESPPPR
jgi:lipopolysaccharide transport protein LptA